jgi:opacity protein-like surface antigen
MRTKLVSLFAGAGGLVLAATAWAAPPPPDTSVPDECRPYLNSPDATNVPPECRPYCTPPVTPAPYAAPEPPPAAPAVAAPVHHRNKFFDIRDSAITTGAGATNYFGSAFTPNSEPGAAWDARLTFGSRSIFGFEAAYVGSINQISVPNQTQQGHLNSNGFDTDLRIGLPYRVQPYMFGGVGYAHLHMDNANGAPSIVNTMNNDVDQFTVPAGGGMAFYFAKHATLDLRGTYKWYPDNRLMVDQTTGGLTGASIHSWTAQARLGYAF